MTILNIIGIVILLNGLILVVVGLLAVVLKEDDLKVSELFSSEVGSYLIPIISILKIIFSAASSMARREVRNQYSVESNITIIGLIMFVAGLLMFKL